jgi:VWFA-related protein
VVNVQGKHGGFISGLTQNNFAVFEDGRPQRVRFFSSESQMPLTMGLLIDTSPSQRRLLPEEQQLSRAFFRQVLRQKDLAFILGFDVNLQMLQDLTSSQRLLDAGLDEAHIGGGGGGGPILNPGPFPTAQHSGATHLWDAMVQACHDPLASQTGRKAIIVITDGEDQGSHASDKDALEAALDSNTVVYAIVAADPDAYGGFYGGAGKLRKIAEQSGGASYNARPGKMEKAFQQISDALRSQYTLAYRSDRPQKDGRFRKIEVKLQGPGTQGDKAHTRSGYFAVRP